jgi:hypothetical protein
MKCPDCARPVRLFNLRRRGLVKKALPRCLACRRYVLTWAHKAVLAALAACGLAAALWMLSLMRVI